jgi:hypothetical protein
LHKDKYQLSGFFVPSQRNVQTKDRKTEMFTRYMKCFSNQRCFQAQVPMAVSRVKPLEAHHCRSSEAVDQIPYLKLLPAMTTSIDSLLVVQPRVLQLFVF